MTEAPKWPRPSRFLDQNYICIFVCGAALHVAFIFINYVAFHYLDGSAIFSVRAETNCFQRQS
jgi:hypothetical protein